MKPNLTYFSLIDACTLLEFTLKFMKSNTSKEIEILKICFSIADLYLELRSSG